MLPNAASFLVTEDCNFRCTYCFESHNKNKMTKEVARKGLEFLCDNAIKDNQNYFNAMIFGGEPLMVPEIVEEILSYGLELGRKHNIEFNASMVTNASLLTPEIKKMLSKYIKPTRLGIQLSVDGIKEVHDQYRVTVDGRPTFEKIEKLIPEWKDLFKDNMNLLSLHGCSNRDTLPYLYESYIFFREQWDIPRIWFMPIHSESWSVEDLDVYEEQLGKIADYVLKHAKEYNTVQEILNYAPLDRCLNRSNRFPHAPCGAGKNFITITAHGELFPCHQIYFNDPNKFTKIGDLETGLDEQKRSLYKYYDNSDLSCAKLDPDCDAYGCYRCIGENLQQNGSILSVVDCGAVRCGMSKIERKIQIKLLKEIEKLGLLNRNNNVNLKQGNNPDNPDCLCDSRGVSDCSGVSNINKKSINIGNNCGDGCNCGDKEQNDYSSNDFDLSDNETIALALKTIIDKVEILESGLDFVIKKMLK